MNRLKRSWDKNWPEVWCAMRRGLPPFVFTRKPQRIGHAVAVFHYHLVEASELADDLQFLKRNGYHAATADELLGHLHASEPLREDSVVLTFDDGPLNFHSVAFPLLQRFEFRAVAFIAPGLHQETADDECPDRLCTWAEIEQMHASGLVDFQSHTLEHRYIPHWPQPWPVLGAEPTAVEAARGRPHSIAGDLRLSKEIIEDRLGKRVRHLAYPNYRATPAASAIATRVGYEGLWCGVQPHRPWNVPGASPTDIVRISGEFLRRLPGRGRRSLASILGDRHVANIRRLLRNRAGSEDGWRGMIAGAEAGGS